MLVDNGIELTVKADRLTGSALRMAMQEYMRSHRIGRASAQKDVPHGEQSAKQLNAQNKPLDHVDIDSEKDLELQSLRRELNRYGVDFAVVEDKDNGVFHVLFKEQDADRVELAMKKTLDAFDRKPMDEQMKQATVEAEDRNAARDLEKTLEESIEKAAKWEVSL